MAGGTNGLWGVMVGGNYSRVDGIAQLAWPQISVRLATTERLIVKILGKPPLTDETQNIGNSS